MEFHGRSTSASGRCHPACSSLPSVRPTRGRRSWTPFSKLRSCSSSRFTAMDLKQLVMLGLQVSIVCTVFGYGLKTTTAALLDVLRRPALLVRSVICVLLIVPALAFALTRFFEIRHEVEVALVALAISPVPPLLPMK